MPLDPASPSLFCIEGDESLPRSHGFTGAHEAAPPASATSPSAPKKREDNVDFTALV